MKQLLGCLLTFSMFVSCRQVGVHYVDGTIEQVFAMAHRENKKVFVLVTSSQCGLCKHFSNFLDSQWTTTRILADDYICYKADILDVRKKDIAQIIKCPSYPFPYFFDKEGNLEAFGFPESKTYDISDLNKIFIDEYKFRELFRLPISTQQYKRLVSLNLQSFLLTKQTPADRVLLDSAYRLAARSLNIAPYPYNIYLSWKLGNTLNKPSDEITRLSRPQLMPSDRLVYGKLIDSIPLRTDSGFLAANKRTDSIAYSFANPSQDCGVIKKGTDYSFNFTFTNTGTGKVVIAKAEHSCSCIELQWPKQPVMPGQKGIITGVYHATDKGRFTKEIYVHVASPQVPMKVISLSGVVD
jgi:hypothetical protein